MGDEPVRGAAGKGQAAPQVDGGGTSSAHGKSAQVIGEATTQVRLEPREESKIGQGIRLLVEQAGPLGERGLPLEPAPPHLPDRIDGGTKREPVDRASHVFRRHAELAGHPDHHATVLPHAVKEERPFPLGEPAREAVVLEEPVQIGRGGGTSRRVRPAGGQVR
jgi:hypothetical protein